MTRRKGWLSRGLSRLMPKGVNGQQTLAAMALLASAMVAMALANSPLTEIWQALLDHPLWHPAPTSISPVFVRFRPPSHLTAFLTPRGLIDAGLMAVFFFVIGLEIKREVLVGDLAHARTRRLPVLAAASGMAAPALVFVLMLWGLVPDGGQAGAALRGWAIPSATDIAFALGVLGLLGHRVPVSLRLFLLTVAVVDDLGATVIIALAYAGPVTWGWIGAGALVLAGMVGLNRAGCNRATPYGLLGLLLWLCVAASGLHPTVAGVLAAITVPMTPRHPDKPGQSKPRHSLLLAMEHRLAPWSAFVIGPLFALANAGVALRGGSAGAPPPLTLAIATALVLGKQAGIFGAVWLAVRLGLAERPRGAGWQQIWGVSLLCGIGFTMSLLIATLAYAQTPAMAAQARLGIIAGSLISALLGLGVLWHAGRASGTGNPPAPKPAPQPAAA